MLTKWTVDMLTKWTCKTCRQAVDMFKNSKLYMLKKSWISSLKCVFRPVSLSPRVNIAPLYGIFKLLLKKSWISSLKCVFRPVNLSPRANIAPLYGIFKTSASPYFFCRPLLQVPKPPPSGSSKSLTQPIGRDKFHADVN